MNTAVALCLLAATAVPARPLFFRRDLISGSRTNDVICEMKDYSGNSQYPPPVVITYADGSSACGCASDIVTGGNASYTECNQIYPSFGQDGYSDSGLRQNACYLSNGVQATCATSCTPNTQPGDGGVCTPTNSESYTLQSPTTVYGSTSSSDNGGATASVEASSTWSPSPSSDDWNSDDGLSSVWEATSSESAWDASSEFVPDASSSSTWQEPSSVAEPSSSSTLDASPSSGNGAWLQSKRNKARVNAVAGGAQVVTITSSATATNTSPSAIAASAPFSSSSGTSVRVSLGLSVAALFAALGH